MRRSVVECETPIFLFVNSVFAVDHSSKRPHQCRGLTGQSKFVSKLATPLESDPLNRLLIPNFQHTHNFFNFVAFHVYFFRNCIPPELFGHSNFWTWTIIRFGIVVLGFNLKVLTISHFTVVHRCIQSIQCMLYRFEADVCSSVKV